MYNQGGQLQDRYLSHEADSQTYSVDPTLTDQHGRDEIAPTATPEPTPTRIMAIMPPGFAADGTVATDPYVFVPTTTPTPDPPPTARPEPALLVTAATGWNHQKGRPVAIDADGMAALDVPADAVVSGYLSIRTGPDSGNDSHTELARMPMPDARWQQDVVYVSLHDASGRILLASDTIDANYRSALLHLEVAPMPHCDGLRLRWQRAATVVVKALTEQPFIDWTDRSGPTPLPPVLTLYAAVSTDGSFDGAEMRAGTSSTVSGHVVIPNSDQDGHVAFAIRADLAPDGLSDIRQTGSPFNARSAFALATGDPDVELDIAGIPYKLYVSLNP